MSRTCAGELDQQPDGACVDGSLAARHSQLDCALHPQHLVTRSVQLRAASVRRSAPSVHVILFLMRAT
jgi:hypothetical protein